MIKKCEIGFFVGILFSLVFAFNGQINISECDQLSAGYLLSCVGPLLHYVSYNARPQFAVWGGAPITQQNSSSSIRDSGRFGSRICSLYKEYKQCAPEALRHRCATLVLTLEAVYDYVCSPVVLANFSSHLDCLLEIDSADASVLQCEQNATKSLKSIASSVAETIDQKMAKQCDAVQDYFYCMMEKYLNACGEKAWQLKVDITKRATSVQLTNCSFVTTPKPEDFLKPRCLENGTCLCHAGYRLKEDKCEDIDECLQLGVCSQKCLNQPGTFTCVCDERYYTKSEDGRRCIRTNLDPAYIFFAHGQSVWNISLDGKAFQLKKASLQKVAMLDLDVEDNMLYYVDIGASKLERIRFEGVFPQTIQNYDLEGTEGIAVDWVGKKLYSARGTDIFVRELDGTLRRTLHRNVFKQPRALSIHPLKGYIFATDWGSQAFVARGDMDGGNFTILINSGLTWPNGLAVDYYADRLYWADAFADMIECSDLDGQNRQVVLKDSNTIPHIFAITIMDDYLYWSDWTYRGILRGNKFNGQNTSVVTQTALLPYGLKVYYSAAQPQAENPCGDDNGGCQHMCLLSPVRYENGSWSHLDYKCMCAEGFNLSPTDNKTCEINCSGLQLQCLGADPRCISKKFWCDGTAHCADKSDEENCPQRICLQNQFQCHNNLTCIVDTKLCDDRINCDDGSDERYC